MDPSDPPTAPTRLRLPAVLVLLVLAWTATADTEGPEPSFEQVLSAVTAVSARVPEHARTAQSLGTEREGTGVVIDGDGLILTIGYLVLEATRVEVRFPGGEPVGAEVVAYDHPSGFGLLRASVPPHVRPMVLGEATGLSVQDRALIVSHDRETAVLPAVIVDRRPFAGQWEYLLEKAIFTSPPHPAFGGAALIGPRGRLLGIGSLFVQDAMRRPRQVPGNMFVPVDELKPILSDLVRSGRRGSPPRPWLGIYAEEVEGLLVVNRLAEEGPAAAAGVMPNDIIVSVDGTSVSSLEGFYRVLWSKGNAGTRFVLEVFRNDELSELSVRSADRLDWLRPSR